MDNSTNNIEIRLGIQCEIFYFDDLALKTVTINLKVEIFDKFIISLNNYIMLSLLAIKANAIL